MKLRVLTLLLCFAMLLCSCAGKDPSQPHRPGGQNGEEQGTVADLGGDSKTFGEEIESTGAYDGYFEGESQDLSVECISGTPNAYKREGTTLTFTAISEQSVYSVSGSFRGNIVIDVGDDHKFDLELHGFSLISGSTNPITVISGDEVSIKAKKDTKNYIYDMRSAIDSTDETLFSGAVHSVVDLEIGGKGELFVISENNNGIHSKDDLQVKNLTLFVACADNALKGNDSVELESCNTTLIASVGDCIKTSSSDISEKGNQRGSITVSGGTHTLYAACDGLDAAYDVIIDGSDTVISIYTDKYSNYSKEVTANSSDTNYIRFTSNKYYYSVKYYNSDSDFVWVNAQYHSTVSGGRTSYYYYSYPKMPDYAKQQIFIYSSEDKLSQDEEYLVMTDYLTPNSGCDTFALTNSGGGLYYEWTNYTTKIQSGGFGGFGGGGPGGFGGGGPGGFGEGNSDKGDHSTKGIKAANEIVINAGTVNIKSYDDAVHANGDTALENGKSPLGNVTVNGGNVTVYSNDDGLHADGTLAITGGTVSVTNSYEGLEGTRVDISGGYVSVNSSDDGINATTTSGTAVSISGGTVYIYCTGDGIDSNSRTSYSGIVFSGGNTVVISNSNGNSAIDTEQGYTYEGGAVIAIMPRGGMSNEATHCDNFTSIGKTAQLSLGSGNYLVAKIGDLTATVKMPVDLNALVVILGDKAPNVEKKTETDVALDSNGVSWN
ncbi:MAG: carbohydrate-binding domain-containing protein [Clostridia bacterium]|nr:carbohydrate-binding domain-containing protein [Clostridia bacterium]